MVDNLLSQYSMIVLDEAHQRSIPTDVLMALVKQLLAKRPLLRVILMSATIAADQFSRYYDNCPILSVQGRTFPVQLYYTEESYSDIVDACLNAVIQLHTNFPITKASDFLVFLHGEEEIESLKSLLLDRLGKIGQESPKFIVTPIYSALSPQAQLLAFEPPPQGVRKIVLATNIAETSITINGIGYVIDSGLVKKRVFQGKKGIETLATLPVSQSEAMQRTGRAGREHAGECYRLYTEDVFYSLSEHVVPDIMRSNISSVVLSLLAMGIPATAVKTFDFMDSPPKSAIEFAVTQLYKLGCINRDATGTLSDLGKKMSRYPLDPVLCRVVIAAADISQAEEGKFANVIVDVLSIIAMLSVPNIFYKPREVHKQQLATIAKTKFVAKEGDHMTLLNVYQGFKSAEKQFLEKKSLVASKVVDFNKIEIDADPSSKSHNKNSNIHHLLRKWCDEHYINHRSISQACSIREQINRMCSDMFSASSIVRLECMGSDLATSVSNSEMIRKAFLKGFFMQTAKREPDGVYRMTSNSEIVSIHPSSVLHSQKPPPEAVLFNDVVITTKAMLREVSVIDAQWLADFK